MRRCRSVRSLLVALLTAASLHALPAFGQDYSDIWWKPDEGGWGVNVVQNDNFMFLTFFIYGQDKNPTWYTAQVTWDGSKYTGPLYRTQGTYWANPWNPGDSPAALQVGSATFQPSSTNAYQATLTYTVTGVATVVKPIERQTLRGLNLGGNYVGGQTGTYASCNASADNGPYIDTYTLAVTQGNVTPGSTLSLAFKYDSGATCTLSGGLDRRGLLTGVPAARYVCTGSLSFDINAVVYELKMTGQGIEGRFTAKLANGCLEDAAFSAAIR
jgi:hypothetical protein